MPLDRRCALSALTLALIVALPAAAQSPVADSIRVVTDGDPHAPDDLAFTLAFADGDVIADVQLIEAGQATSLAGSFRIDYSAAGQAALRIAPAIDLDRFIGHAAALRIVLRDGGPRTLALRIDGPEALAAVRGIRQAVADGSADYRPILPLETAGNLRLLDLRDADAAPLDHRAVVAGDGRQAALATGSRLLAGAPHAYAARYAIAPSGKELAQPLTLTPSALSAYTQPVELAVEIDAETGRPGFTLAGGINLELSGLVAADGQSLLDRFDRRPTASGDLRLTLRAGQSLADLGYPGAVLKLTAERRFGGETLSQALTLGKAASGGDPATTGASGSNGSSGTGKTGSGKRSTAGTPLPTLPTTPAAPAMPPVEQNSVFPKAADKVEAAPRRPRVSAAARALSGNIARYEYDALGNPTASIDPLGNATRTQWDRLSRPFSQTLPPPGDGSPAPVIQTGHDALDRLISVIDPRGLSTAYAYDALGQVTQLTSPDTGVTRTVTDGAGNPVTRTDARGQAAQHSYDALNRVVASSWPGATGQELKTVVYTWDSPRIGSLGSVEERDAGGQLLSRTTYTYDAHGRVTGETRALGANAPTTIAYAYAPGGRLISLTYPSGRVLTYSHDAAGRVTAISAAAPGGSAKNVVSGVSYNGLGQVRGYSLGNGQVLTRSLDADGRITGYTQGAAQITLSYDAASRIVAVNDGGDAARNATYAYDALGRLTAATRGATTTTYTWDAVGNRLSRTRTTTGSSAGTATDRYQPAATSNRLQSVTAAGGSPRPQQYDNAGHLIGDGARSFSYDARGRLTQAILSASATYQVDAAGRRVRKNAGQPGEVVYHYDTAGHLIAESGPDGKNRRDYLWLNDLPVAVVVGDTQ